MVSITTVTIRTDSRICKRRNLFSSKSLKQDLGGIWRCRIIKTMDLIYYSFAPLILFRVPYTLDLLP